MENTYKPRFMNGGEVVTKAAPDCGYTISFQDDGEIRQGDVGGSTSPTRPEGGLEPKIHGTSPTYTREELVEVMAKSAFVEPSEWSYGDMKAALDALISIGAVRVK